MIDARDRGRDEQGDRGQQQHSGLRARVGGVEFLRVVLEAAEQERAAQHEEAVGHDGPGHRRFHEVEHPGAQRGDGDDELGQVAERRVEQSADRVPGLRGHALGRAGSGGRPAERWRRPTAGRGRCGPPGADARRPGPPARRPGASSGDFPGDPRGPGSWFPSAVGETSGPTPILYAARAATHARRAVLRFSGRRSRRRGGLRHVARGADHGRRRRIGVGDARLTLVAPVARRGRRGRRGARSGVGGPPGSTVTVPPPCIGRLAFREAPRSSCWILKAASSGDLRDLPDVRLPQAHQRAVLPGVKGVRRSLQLRRSRGRSCGRRERGRSGRRPPGRGSSFAA